MPISADFGGKKLILQRDVGITPHTNYLKALNTT